MTFVDFSSHSSTSHLPCPLLKFKSHNSWRSTQWRAWCSFILRIMPCNNNENHSGCLNLLSFIWEDHFFCPFINIPLTILSYPYFHFLIELRGVFLFQIWFISFPIFKILYDLLCIPLTLLEISFKFREVWRSVGRDIID